MACGISYDDSYWLPSTLQNRLLQKRSGNSSLSDASLILLQEKDNIIDKSLLTGIVGPDINNWLKLLRYTVDDYEERPRNCKHNTRIIKGLSDSDLSAHSFDFIDKEINTTKDNSSDGKLIGDDDNEEDDECTSIFDDILCNLGNEIFQLETYHRKYFQQQGQRSSDSSEFEHHVMNVFDEFLEEVRSSTPLDDNDSTKPRDVTDKNTSIDNTNNNSSMDLKVPVISKVPSFGNISALSDEVFLKSGTSSRDGSNSNLYVQCDSSTEDHVIVRNLSNRIDQTKYASYDVNKIFDKGSGAPVPPKRKNRLSTPSMERSEVHVKKPVPKPRTFININNDQRIKLDSNISDITDRSICQKSTSQYMSHKNDSDSGNNSPASDYSDYQNLWHCTSGCQNRSINSDSFKENYAKVNVIRYDSFKEISNVNPIKQRIVVCGPHTKSTANSNKNTDKNENDTNNKHADRKIVNDKNNTKNADRRQENYVNINNFDSKKTENEGVAINPRFDNFDKNKRYSYDAKKRVDYDSKSRLINSDMVRCTSDCDITDECHRNLTAKIDSKSNSDIIARGKREEQYDTKSLSSLKREENFDTKSVSSLKMPKSFETTSEPNYQNISEILELRNSASNNCEQNDSISDIVDNNSSVYDTDCGHYTTAPSATEEEWESSVELLSDSDSFVVAKNFDNLIKKRLESRRTVSESTDCASESPIYENVRDLIKVKPIPDDVQAWKALLLSVDYIEDEEDEWATKEQTDIYTRDCQPNGPNAPYTGYVIPRVRPVYSKKHRRDERDHQIHQQYSGEEHDDWSPDRSEGTAEHGSVKDKAKIYEERGMIVGLGDQRRIKDRTGSSPPLPPPYRIPDPRLHQLEFRSSPNFDGSRPPRAISLGAQKVERVAVTKDILHCGNVRVVKKAENGIKIPKQWHDNFLILKRDRMEFYDSEKAWRDQHLYRFDIVLKEGLVDLENVKKRLKIVDANNDMYVTEHPNEREAKEWMAMIRSNALVIASASQPSPLASPSPTMARHRTKSTSKAASDESVNDIPSTGGSQENIPKNNRTTSKILDKWLRKRPQKDALINKGIYQDEAVFGRNLWEVCPLERPRIPEFVVRCVRVLEGKVSNLTTDGIYRASGNLSQIQRIRLEVNQKNLSVVNDTVDIHVLTGVLKLFFRELKEPLIPFEFFQKCINASSKKDHDTRVKEFRDIIRKLPDCNKDTLTFFLEHLLNVVKYEEKNRMTISNLAIVLGPTILWAPPNATQNLAVDFLKQNEVIEILLKDFKEIFAEDGKDFKRFETKM